MDVGGGGSGGTGGGTGEVIIGCSAANTLSPIASQSTGLFYS